MRIELAMTVRGEERLVEWADGRLSGDDEILRRVQPLIDAGRLDADDLVSVLRGVEQVTAQHVSVVNLDLAEPVDVPRSRRGRLVRPAPPVAAG